MKHKLPFSLLISFLSCFTVVYCQNIAVNTTGTAAAATNMFEVTQSNAAANMVAAYAINSSVFAGTEYGFKALASGASTTNVAGYFSATNGITNNYAIIVPANSGSVGIGTSGPTQKLHVVDGNLFVEYSNTFEHSLLGGGSLELYRSPSAAVPTTNGYIDFKDNSADDYDFRINYNYSYGTNGGFEFISTTNGQSGTLANRMTILNSNGNVGIGTTGPAAKLHVIGTSQNTLAIESAAYPEMTFRVGGVIKSYDAIATSATGYFSTSGVNDRIIRADAGNLLFGYQASEWMRITTTGNVGIGTNTPSGRLDVLAGAARTGTHATTPSFYVTGTISSGQTGPSGNNIEFRHDNGSQGIGFGYNTIYQTGSNTNQELNLLSRGTGAITLNAFGYSTGNVGIGLASPLAKLHISASTGIRLDSPQDDAFPAITAATRTTGGEIRAQSWQNADYGTLILSAGGETGINQKMSLVLKGYGVTDNTQARFLYGNNPIMTIQGFTGYVGIGTISPGRALEVVGSGPGQHTGIFKNTGLYGVAIGACNGQTYGSLQGISVALGTNTNIVMQESGGNVGIANNNPSYKLHVGGDIYANGGWFRVSGNQGLYWESWGPGLYCSDGTWLRTYNNCSFWAGTGIIATGGSMGIGTAAPAYQLELSANSAGKPGSSFWTVTSDARLKNIEGAYTKGLKEILQLQPIVYHYKNEGGRKFDDSVLNSTQIGFSAQEVQKIFPEAVGESRDGYLNLDMQSIIIAYTNAIKEQQKTIDDLRMRVDAMEKSLKAARIPVPPTPNSAISSDKK